MYDFGKVLPPPLMMLILGWLQNSIGSDLVLRFIFVIADVLIGRTLASLSGSNEGMLVHLLNPLAIMACVGRNLNLFNILLILIALNAAKSRQSIVASTSIALATYFDLRSAVFSLPVFLLLKDRQSKVIATATFAALLAITLSLFGPGYLESVYFSRLRVDDLRPNCGLFWYFHQQVFATFSSLFKVTLQLVPMAFVISSAIKFSHDPLFLAFILQASQTILKADPSAADYVLLFGLLYTQRQLLERTRITFILLFGLAGIFVFLMRVWDYLIQYNGFNMNFYYSFTLAWNIVLVMITLEMVLAHLKEKIYTDNPVLNEKEFEKCKLMQR